MHLCLGRSRDQTERVCDVYLCDTILRGVTVDEGVHLFQETFLSQIHGFDASRLNVQLVIVHELCELSVVEERGTRLC